MALQRELDTAKNIFTKKLLDSRESRQEMLRMLKKAIHDLENGLTEDDASFENFLITIKEADRVLNNSVLCTQALGSQGQLEAAESLISRLQEQADSMRKEIENFEQIKVCRVRDIKLNDKIIKKQIKEICYNILAYHPDTFKAPKMTHEFSILTSNQASSLVGASKGPKRSFSKPCRESESNLHRMSKSMSKPFDTKSKFKTTMPTVREYSEGDTLRRSMTVSSQRKLKSTKRDHEILKLAQKIRINTLNFCGKQAEGIAFTDKIKKISKMMDYLAVDRAEKCRKQKRRKRASRSVAK
ncbi:unnamed protein product [Moneuplotes crassus]|uniref:Uncharacterized protein n=1 Tax=Euplotes crassus TaxID=5936 RepID=A0AAD1XH29_EUPCR|nr:unnamed protein product [Moneuplotes crassus]